MSVKKKVLTPESPKSLKKWTTSTNSQSTKTKVIGKTRIPRKIVGIPANLFIFLLIIFSVIGASSYIKYLAATVNVEAIDYSGFETNGWNNNDPFDMTTDREIIKTFTIVNTGDEYRMDTIIKFRATASNLENGDCNIWLLDNNDGSLVGNGDSTVTNDALEVSANYNDINAGGSRNGKWKMECIPDYDGTVTIDLEMIATAEYSFN